MRLDVTKIKIKNPHSCDHCQNPLSHSEIKSNESGASGYMYWFCSSCLYLLNESKKNEPKR